MLSALPNDLGRVRTLPGLNVVGHPLYYPPADVLAQGVVAVLAFLRMCAAP